MTDSERPASPDARWYPPTGYLPVPSQVDFLPAAPLFRSTEPTGATGRTLAVPAAPARRRRRLGPVLVAVALVVAGLSIGGVTSARSLLGAPTGQSSTAAPSTRQPTASQSTGPQPTAAPSSSSGPSSPSTTRSASRTPSPTAKSGPRAGPLPGPQDEDDATRIVESSALYRAKPASRMDCADADPSSMSVKQMRSWAGETLSRCLMPYWSPAFVKATGYTLPTPKVIVIEGTTVKTPCGSTTVDSNEAFFCSTNDTIYLWARNIRDQPAEIAVSHFVFAHEFGHHLQWAAGILESSEALAYFNPKRESELSRRIELQASCFGGRFLGAIGPSLSRFQSAGFPDTVRTGDRPGGPRTHGSYASNQRWIGAGYRNTSMTRCNTFTAPTSQVG